MFDLMNELIISKKNNLMKIIRHFEKSNEKKNNQKSYKTVTHQVLIIKTSIFFHPM